MKKTISIFMACLVMSFVQLNAQKQNSDKGLSEKEKYLKSLNEQKNQKEGNPFQLETMIQSKSSDYVITAEHVSSLTGTKHVYIRQAIEGIEIAGTESSVHVDKNGKTIQIHNNFIENVQQTVKNRTASLSADQAINAVARQMGYKVENLNLIEKEEGVGRKALYNKAGISNENIPVKLMYYFRENYGTSLVWELSVSELNTSDWWNFRVDASTGQIIDKYNFTQNCNVMGDHSNHNHKEDTEVMEVSLRPAEYPLNVNTASTAMMSGSYNVYPMPMESPYDGARQVVVNPENVTASPFGWLDTDGVAGPEFTITRGNNVYAYEDRDGDNVPGFSPDGGASLDFDFPLDLNDNPVNSESAIISNLFYWNNIVHDVMYFYGFDEASGNFQENNYGNGGVGSDSVNAEAQNAGNCNANFATPADGSNPRMQMFLCNNTIPSRDSDLDNLVIVHEYAHGITNRLTGGAANVGCLANDEQMGEGWSDFYGYMLTMKAGETGTDSRPVGNYLFGQPEDGPGIRPFPYNTDMAVNPQTYDDIKTAIIPHGVGSVWATMLFEMTWGLIDIYGFDPDFYNGTGGNNIAIQLVTEALKLQPCSPGFVDGRDAILAADQLLYGGANECVIWSAFAKRGLGFSADQGVSTSRSDGTEAFDLPPTLVDNEAPVITCITNQTEDTDPGVCTYTHSGTAWDATATDNCFVSGIAYELTGATTGTGTTLDGVVFNQGETTVTWTATDSSGNTDVCSYTVTVEDNEDPVITCIGNETVDTDAGVCSYTHNGTSWDATATDNCSATVAYELTGATTGTGTSLDGVVLNFGTTTVTWTATDVGGNTDVCSYTVNVEDNEAPVISCTTNKTADTNAGVCTYTHLGNFWDASYDDNCTATLSYELTGATTGTGSTLNGVTFNLGVTTVTWTVTDVGGNTDVCSYTVTVEDNEAPEVSCVADATVETDADVCNYTHSGTSWDATATDNCSLNTLTYSLSGATTGTGTSLDGVTFNLGATTVTWTATDAIGNSESCTTTITVEDTEAPVIICISSKLRDTDPGECTYTHSGTLWDSLASDNCNVFSLTYELSGATTGTGNSLDGVTFNLGTTTVVWTVIDDAGNTDVCTYTVTIEDNEAPVVSCTSNQSVDTDADVCTYTHSGTAWDATATDNCGVAAVEYTLSGATTGSGMTLDGIVFNLGTTTVTWTATDTNGNTALCSYEITVEDNQSPEISCGGNQTVDADAGSCSYTHSGTGWNATATDNCSVSTITYSLSGATSGTGSSLSGVTFNLGVTTVTWTATDAAGNTDVCSFTVTVEDNESPQAVCQDLTIQLDANGMASILVEDLNGGSSDNCGNSALTYTASKTEFDCGDVGVNTVILTVTDAAGNSSSCTAIVTVEDLIAPEALCVTDFTLELDENGAATLTAAMLDGGSMDNCAIADISISQTEFDCSDIGENTVTVTVTDSEGNSTSCTSVVTVADTLPPVISCPGDVTVDPNGNGTYVVEDFTGGVTATDNCTDPVVLITQEPAPNTMLSAGTTYTVTFTAEDEAGNTSSCSFELEVTPFLGTDNFNLSSLTMYPNPAATRVNIGNPNLIAVDQISIYDVRGRMVVQQQYSTPQGAYALDVSELSSAVYMVMIQSENKQTVKRLIVE